jgi:hypothetical protein
MFVFSFPQRHTNAILTVLTSQYFTLSSRNPTTDPLPYNLPVKIREMTTGVLLIFKEPVCYSLKVILRFSIKKYGHPNKLRLNCALLLYLRTYVSEAP